MPYPLPCNHSIVRVVGHGDLVCDLCDIRWVYNGVEFIQVSVEVLIEFNKIKTSAVAN